MKLKIFVLASVLVLFVIFSGCTETGGREVFLLKSFTSPSGDAHKTPNNEIFEPVALKTDGENTRLSMQFELLEKPVKGNKIKLTLEEGLEYVSGPFTKNGNDYYLLIEIDTISSEEAIQSFVIEVTEKGKHKAKLTVLDENEEFVEMRFINICVADNAEQAVQTCTDAGCQTKECIKEKLKVDSTN